jgi:hypothetical protein
VGRVPEFAEERCHRGSVIFYHRAYPDPDPGRGASVNRGGPNSRGSVNLVHNRGSAAQGDRAFGGHPKLRYDSDRRMVLWPNHRDDLRPAALLEAISQTRDACLGSEPTTPEALGQEEGELRTSRFTEWQKANPPNQPEARLVTDGPHAMSTTPVECSREHGIELLATLGTTDEEPTDRRLRVDGVQGVRMPRRQRLELQAGGLNRLQA